MHLRVENPQSLVLVVLLHANLISLLWLREEEIPLIQLGLELQLTEFLLGPIILRQKSREVLKVTVTGKESKRRYSSRTLLYSLNEVHAFDVKPHLNSLWVFGFY